MGCLGLLLELIVDLPFFILEELMLMVLPEKKLGTVAHFILELLIGAFSACLLIAIIVGIVFQFLDSEKLSYVGKFLIFIPLSVIVLQITIGIILKIRNKRIGK